MNIDRLQYFAAVVETKNLRRAADLVGISPGSMSKAISVLESELGVKLIRPEGRGIEITAEGHRVFQSSSTLLNECRRFAANLKNPRPNGNESKLRIGTFEVFSSYFASALIESEFPHIDVLLLELTPGSIEQAVEDGLVEIGLTYLPAPNLKLDFIEVGKFEMGLFGLKKWQNEPFLKWPFAVPVTPFKINSLDHTSLDMWPQTKPRTIKYEFELLETALQTSRLGQSVLHCPDFIIKLHNRYVLPEYRLVQLPGSSGSRTGKKIKIYLVAKKDGRGTKGIEGKIAKFFRKLEH